mmetsp:Transcript_45335/g.98353  ORF Transcript_45335/g.98353 Transcript_45335/m.98353 type:complete len:235 (-) Transcript_45335:899-1603(-)
MSSCVSVTTVRRLSMSVSRLSRSVSNASMVSSLPSVPSISSVLVDVSFLHHSSRLVSLSVSLSMALTSLSMPSTTLPMGPPFFRDIAARATLRFWCFKAAAMSFWARSRLTATSAERVSSCTKSAGAAPSFLDSTDPKVAAASSLFRIPRAWAMAAASLAWSCLRISNWCVFSLHCSRRSARNSSSSASCSSALSRVVISVPTLSDKVPMSVSLSEIPPSRVLFCFPFNSVNSS